MTRITVRDLCAELPLQYGQGLFAFYNGPPISADRFEQVKFINGDLKSMKSWRRHGKVYNLEAKVIHLPLRYCRHVKVTGILRGNRDSTTELVGTGL
jgi:hypothetical protein